MNRLGCILKIWENCNIYIYIIFLTHSFQYLNFTLTYYRSLEENLKSRIFKAFFKDPNELQIYTNNEIC
jgi:hypothetical protein